MTTDSRSLLQLLLDLDSCREDWGIYVNTEDPLNDWRMGFCEFDYGNRVPIGSLKELSFNRQDDTELLYSVLHEQYGRTIGWIEYGNNQVLLNVEKMVELYRDSVSRLCPKFRAHIKKAVEMQRLEWKLKESQAFIEHALPWIIEKHLKANAISTNTLTPILIS